jgi:hypothetical protein
LGAGLDADERATPPGVHRCRARHNVRPEPPPGVAGVSGGIEATHYKTGAV